MPEMPEVEIIKRYLDDKLVGKNIKDICIKLDRLIKYPSPSKFERRVKGKTISAVIRKGKYIWLEIDKGYKVIFHLRMTGALVYSSEGEVLDSARIVFSFNDSSVLCYYDTRTLGAVYCIATEETGVISALGNMGAEPLSKEFSPKYLANILAGKSTKIKTFIIKQEYIGGVGNIYADEALFLANIHPLRSASSLNSKEIKKLHKAINKVISEGIKDGGTTFRDYRNGAGEKGRHQEKLNVYARKGMPCTVCNTVIEKITVGGRGSHYCPRCQRINDK